MAWARNRESAFRWLDYLGPIGGFARGRITVADKATSIGPVSSGDGSKWELYVQNDGTFSAVQVEDET